MYWLLIAVQLYKLALSVSKHLLFARHHSIPMCAVTKNDQFFLCAMRTMIDKQKEERRKR